MFYGILARGMGAGAFGGGRMGGFMPLMMIIRLAILIALIVLAVKLYKKHIGGPASALKLLDERFAKGEIDEEEYTRRKQFLTQKK